MYVMYQDLMIDKSDREEVSFGKYCTANNEMSGHKKH